MMSMHAPPRRLRAPEPVRTPREYAGELATLLLLQHEGLEPSGLFDAGFEGLATEAPRHAGHKHGRPPSFSLCADNEASKRLCFPGSPTPVAPLPLRMTSFDPDDQFRLQEQVNRGGPWTLQPAPSPPPRASPPPPPEDPLLPCAPLPEVAPPARQPLAEVFASPQVPSPLPPQQKKRQQHAPAPPAPAECPAALRFCIDVPATRTAAGKSARIAAPLQRLRFFAASLEIEVESRSRSRSGLGVAGTRKGTDIGTFVGNQCADKKAERHTSVEMPVPGGHTLRLRSVGGRNKNGRKELIRSGSRLVVCWSRSQGKNDPDTVAQFEAHVLMASGRTEPVTSVEALDKRRNMLPWVRPFAA